MPLVRFCEPVLHITVYSLASANYTSRVIDNSLSHEQVYEALKFLGEYISSSKESYPFFDEALFPRPRASLVSGTVAVVRLRLSITQFLGDVGQPLHVEAFEVGGNDVKAKCSGTSTNLYVRILFVYMY